MRVIFICITLASLHNDSIPVGTGATGAVAVAVVVLAGAVAADLRGGVGDREAVGCAVVVVAPPAFG